jgi:hypothetical protein
MQENRQDPDREQPEIIGYRLGNGGLRCIFLQSAVLTEMKRALGPCRASWLSLKESQMKVIDTKISRHEDPNLVKVEFGGAETPL